MKKSPHTDSSSRSYTEIRKKSKYEEHPNSYEGKTSVSSSSTVDTVITRKSAYSTSDADHVVKFELNLRKIENNERNFRLNRKKIEDKISMETSISNKSE